MVKLRPQNGKGTPMVTHWQVPELGVEPRISPASLSCHPLTQAGEPLEREAWVMGSYCVVKSPGSAQACLIARSSASPSYTRPHLQAAPSQGSATGEVSKG